MSAAVAANERLCIAVQDTGIGMTGRRLLPCRQVDSSHALDITSTPGVGTTMRVLLSLRHARSAAA